VADVRTAAPLAWGTMLAATAAVDDVIGIEPRVSGGTVHALRVKLSPIVSVVQGRGVGRRTRFLWAFCPCHLVPSYD